MNFYIRMLLVFTAFASIASCKKDTDEHPEIQTVVIEPLSPTRALLKGNIVSKGSFGVVDHGFLYSTSYGLNDNTGTKVSLGAEIKEGMISKEVQNLSFYQSSSNTLYARAYLTNNNGTVYGAVISMTMPTVSTASIFPSSGKAGDQITISGQFYSLSKEEVSVSFGGISGKVTEVSPSKITVEVPAGINTSNSSSNQITLAISINGQQVYSSHTFKVVPTFKSFLPTSGTPGTTVSISGDNIPNYYSYYSTPIKVYVGETLVNNLQSYNTSGLSITIPGSLSQVKNAISIEVDGVKTVLPGDFTVLSPLISSISPPTGLPGSSFSIFGSNFPTNSFSSNAQVTIGGIPANASSISSGQINVTIPSNLPVGDYKVAVKSGPFTVEASQTLKVQALAISGFSPSSGTSGKEVTLTGTFTPDQYYDIYFGTSWTSARALSSSTLKAYVPSFASPGVVKIIVKHGAQNAESSSNFTILAPSITSFSPSSGVAGTIITISGSGFSTSTYNNTVKFGTVSSNILSATESTITAAVPSNLTGSMKITVVANGQTAVSASNFTAN